MKLLVTNLCYPNGPSYLFRKLSFSLGAGELMVIEGSNGAGKTTLLKILVGLISSYQGEVSWQSAANSCTELQSQLSYVGHQDNIDEALTLRENIESQLKKAGCAYLQDDLQNLLSAFNLKSHQNKLALQLSKGQRRKGALITLLLKQKPLWVLDEPFCSLDSASIDKLLDFFTLHQQQGGMIVMSSHSKIEKAQHRICL